MKYRVTVFFASKLIGSKADITRTELIPFIRAERCWLITAKQPLCAAAVILLARCLVCHTALEI